MTLTEKQARTMHLIQLFAPLLGVDHVWATAIAMTESSLGLNQSSPTGCKGVFQMSTIAMKDLLREMTNLDDDTVDVVCGLLFLRLLFNRHKSIDEATLHFCDPADKGFYLQKVKQYMEDFRKEEVL